ncbi:MAG: hypothetical protein E7265_11640 [Lachnospiraceae bacterium]|nr:hypothetical protein [Lachnospiraceae bacterium]
MEKTIKKIVVFILCCGLICSLFITGSTPVSAAKKLSLGKKKVTLKVKEKYQIRIKKVKVKKNKSFATFKTSSKKVAKVSKKGVITAVKQGNAVITVTKKKNKKVKAKLKVKVVKEKSENTQNNESTQAPNTPVAATPTPTGTPAPVASLFDADYEELVSRSDIEYTGLITFSPNGMPVANGKFGGPVWQNNENVLAMQLNHTDTFMFNDASANSEWDYRSGALGVLNVDFGSPVFSDGLKQCLSLYDGRLNLKDDDISVNVISDNKRDTVLISVDDNRKNPADITIDLKMTRSPNERKGLWSAVSSFDINNDEKYISLNQVFSEPSDTGISVNDHYCATSVTVNVPEADASVSSVDSQTARVTIPSKTGKFTIVIGGCSSLDTSEDVANASYYNCVDSEGYDKVYESNKKWWKDFWDKSYVYLPTKPEYEKRRTYYMYLAGISNRGKYPSKYNGGNWIAEGDCRDWGNYYWNWNQDSLYQPLNQANHMELMEPLFTMREDCYEQYKVAAEQLWGIEGGDALFIGETAGVLGAETLPESIVPDLQKYLEGKGSITDEIRAFGEKRNRFLPPWNWKFSAEPENNSVSYVSHTLVATQETAEYYWQKYEYTQDKEWLKDHAYKFIKGAAELYRNYSGFIQEEDGYFHFNRTNLHEHIWGGRDVIDDLSLARGTFAVAVKVSEILNVDEDLRKEWQYCLDNLAPYPLASDPGALGWTAEHRSGNVTWAQGLRPATLTRAFEGSETPQFKMLEKYDVLNMETRDQGLDNGDWEIAINTFYDSSGYRNQFINTVVDENGSSRFLEDTAKLGLADELKKILETQFKMFRNTPNLIHDQGDYYSAEGYGTWSAAIQQSLMQSLAPLPGMEHVIRVFPAWPTEYDAKYKLLAKGGFLVASSMTDGEVEYVEITSQLGGNCRIRNPWNENLVLYRNGVKSETIASEENALVTFETGVNEGIVILREGTTPDMYKTSEVK